MKGIILCAGRGSRLDPLTADRPKALIRLEGATLLERQQRALLRAGAREVGCVVGWRSEAFSDIPLRKFTNASWAQTSMVESLGAAEDWLGSHDCLVAYGDIVFASADARAVAETQAPIVVGYDPDWRSMWERRFADPLSDAETFRHRGGEVVEIGRPIERIEDVQGQYMGLLKITPMGWRELQDVQGATDMTDLLRIVVTTGRARVAASPIAHPWWEFDSPSDISLGIEVLKRIDILEELKPALESGQ